MTILLIILIDSFLSENSYFVDSQPVGVYALSKRMFRKEIEGENDGHGINK
jgi:hypothetical protein